jgi:cytochrome P450
MNTIALDHIAPGIDEELFGWGRYLRAEAPIAYSEAHGGFWVVSRYEDVVKVATDHESFTNTQGVTFPPLPKFPLPAIPLECDAPEHARYRGVLTPFFRSPAVRGHEQAVRGIVSSLIDTFIEQGEADLIGDFAHPLPALVLAEVFGFTAEEGRVFLRGFGGMVEAAGSQHPEAQAGAIDAFLSLLAQKLDQRRCTPGDDLTTAIVQAEIDGAPLTGEEALGLLFAVAGAGTETTGHAIGHILHRLAEDLDLRERLTRDPSLIPSAVEEVLRLQPPAFMLARTVSRNVSIGEVELEPGDKVLMFWGWANRDEAIFDHADDFILDRAPNPHLTFGAGVHKCVGQHLARLELRVAVEEVLRRLPDYAEESDPGLPRLRGGWVWGFDALPVRFTPGQRAGR